MQKRGGNLLTSWRLSRIGTVLVVVLLALSHLAGFAHFALVQHAQCPEHGDWMHVHADQPHAAASAEANWHGQDEIDGHDHCSAPTALRDRLTPGAPALIATVRAQLLPRPPPPLPHTPQPLTAAVWRTAPKTSPPAQA